MNLALNKTQVVYLTNKSGGAVAQGDVVIVSGADASAFTTTTTAAYIDGMVGVITEGAGIANDAIGAVALAGYVPKINLSSSASLGNLVRTHSVAKQGVPHAAPMTSGDFAMVLGTGTSPAAIMFPNPIQPQSAAAAYYAPTGLTGATGVSRYVGATASGAPASGTFAIGDFVIDRSGAVWICVVAGAPGTWSSIGGGAGRTLISEITPSGVATVGWTGIAGTYKKLIIEFAVRSSVAALYTDMQIEFNADTTSANYLSAILNAYGSTVGAGSGDNRDIAFINGDTAAAAEFTLGKIEIIQYANINFYKQAISQSSFNRGSGGVFEVYQAGAVDWLSGSAIDQIDINIPAGNYMSGSVFRLYGEN